jgi:preprotein translocase subunit SecD
VNRLLLLAMLAANPTGALEVRLVVSCSVPHAGKPVKDPAGAGQICLDRTAFLTTTDIESAEARHNSAGHWVVFLTFHNDAAMRELQVTLRNIGHRVAILLDGQAVAAPTISSGSRFLFVDGGFTQTRAEEIAAGFNERGGK